MDILKLGRLSKPLVSVLDLVVQNLSLLESSFSKLFLRESLNTPLGQEFSIGLF